MTTNINVIHIPSFDMLSITVDGTCNHATTHFETEDFDLVYPDGQDQTYSNEYEICDHCSSYRIEGEDEWQGVQVMPIGYSKEYDEVQ